MNSFVLLMPWKGKQKIESERVSYKEPLIPLLTFQKSNVLPSSCVFNCQRTQGLEMKVTAQSRKE